MTHFFWVQTFPLCGAPQSESVSHSAPNTSWESIAHSVHVPVFAHVNFVVSTVGKSSAISPAVGTVTKSATAPAVTKSLALPDVYVPVPS